MTTCILCAAGGREPGPRSRQAGICADCRAYLVAAGRAWCSRGQHAVSATEWHRGVCRACGAAARAARYAAHRDAELARQRAYYAANAPARRAAIKAWKRQHPDKVRRQEARRRARNPERHRAQMARYRARHRAVLRARWQDYRIRRLLRTLRGG